MKGPDNEKSLTQLEWVWGDGADLGSEVVLQQRDIRRNWSFYC